MRAFIILTLSVLTFSIVSAQPNWKLKKVKDGITIYTSKVDGFHHDSFKATMTVEASVNEFTALLKDIDSFPSWGYNTKYTNLLETSGDTLQIYYNESTAPFPFSNRDGIYRNIFRWDTTSTMLIVDVKMLDDYMDKKKGVVRVSGDGEWQIRILDNKIDITFIMNIDPGGSIPSWLSNMFNDEGPYYSMDKLRGIIESDTYQGIRFDFIPSDYQD